MSFLRVLIEDIDKRMRVRKTGALVCIFRHLI